MEDADMKRIILFFAMVALVSSCAKQPMPDGSKDNRESDGLDFRNELSLSFMADTIVFPDFAGKEVERIECECDWVETWFEADDGLYMYVMENPGYEFYPYEDEERRPQNWIYGNESSSRDAVLSVTLGDGETYSVKVHQKARPAAKMSVRVVPADEDMQPVGGSRNSIWSFCLDEIELGENTEDMDFFIMPDTYLYLYYGYRYEGWEKVKEIFYDIIMSGGDEHVHVFNLEEYVRIRESHDGFIFNTDNLTYLVYVPIDDEGNRDTSINVLTKTSPL